MRRPAVTLFGRLKLVLQLVLALVAFAPAVSAHACADRSCAAVAVIGEAVSDQGQGQDQPGCADCGPACANGCCHAPHPATTPELPPVSAPAFQAMRLTWGQAVEPAPVDPSGPRRPPRA